MTISKTENEQRPKCLYCIMIAIKSDGHGIRVLLPVEDGREELVYQAFIVGPQLDRVARLVCLAI